MIYLAISILILLIIFAIIIFLQLQNKRSKVIKSTALQQFIEFKEIDVTNVFISEKFDVLHDENQELIWYIAMNQKKLQYMEIAYNQVIEVQWLIDNQCIRTFRKNDPNVNSENDNKINEAYRLKSATITLIVDVDGQKNSIHLPLYERKTPITFKEIANGEVGAWYETFVHIIKKEEAKTASS